MTNYKNLFLRQSYIDSYDEYERSITRGQAVVWDYVILTASNEAQADSYRQQIAYRQAAGKLPAATHFAVIPDPDGLRVGSGGATLNVLRYIREECGEDSFKGRRILVIHSGGDSKRIPQYSAMGKLFSPVPRQLPDGRRSTLFDEFIIGMTGVPARISDGMLVLSGDVLLLFNPLQIDFYSKGAAALSIKKNVQTGKNHGVFLRNDDGNVGRFLHKQTVETLTDAGAVDANGDVNIDTGAVIFDSNILEELYAMVDTQAKFDACVNEKVRLSFYADFLYPLAADATLEQFYLETPEGDFSPELSVIRRELFERLHKYPMKLLCFSPASFIHFGTTRELLHLVTDEIESYRFLNWSALVNTNYRKKNAAVSNSYVSLRATVGDGSYIEDSYIHRGTVIGEGSVISGVTLENVTVPAGTVLHGLKLNDGKFVVRMYGINDNPKEAKLFGKPIDTPLWTAKIYPVCDSIDEAVEKTLHGKPAAEYLSLAESFAMADVTQILPWQDKLDDKVKSEQILEAIDTRTPASEAVKALDGTISDRVKKILLHEAEKSDFGRKIRIYYYLSRFFTGEKREELELSCFAAISDAVTENAWGHYPVRSDMRIAKDEVTTRLPVRVNFGGGWSDTPPHCNENGGLVLNAAIKLDGRLPIETVLRRLPEYKVVLASADLGSYGEFTSLAELQDCKNPSDPFALHKAALLATDVLPLTDTGETLEQILKRRGGGIYLSTQVINIPRGSGLGTSSILAGACVKGIYDFFGVDATENELYTRVLCMEQLMSTGGGWQDQVGGLSRGFKVSTSSPGLFQEIDTTTLHLAPETVAELNERYSVIYTGQRRLARNLLREVIGRYIASDPETVYALGEIQHLAVLMQYELSRGHLEDFARLMNRHWELSQQIDSGCTNTCINQIFVACEDLICGKMICGAGGGGFLQVLRRPGVTHADLRERLLSVFAESGVDVWTCEFYV